MCLDRDEREVHPEQSAAAGGEHEERIEIDTSLEASKHATLSPAAGATIPDSQPRSSMAFPSEALGELGAFLASAAVSGAPSPTPSVLDRDGDESMGEHVHENPADL